MLNIDKNKYTKIRNYIHHCINAMRKLRLVRRDLVMYIYIQKD